MHKDINKYKEDHIHIQNISTTTREVNDKQEINRWSEEIDVVRLYQAYIQSSR